jgi:transmembrane sensor
MIASATAPEVFAFTDGSRVAVAAGGRLDLLDNRGTSFSALLASGQATFDVRPGGPRRWSVECGVLSVEVVGTRFTVERVAGGARVSVERGTVLVRGERVRDRVQRLTAGDSLEVAAPETQLTGPAASGLAADSAVASSAVSAPSAPSPATASIASAAPAASVRSIGPAASVASVASAASAAPATSAAAAADWRKLAEHQDNAGAYAALGPAGIASSAQHASVDDLLTLADVARLSGHPADAVVPLTRVMQEHADDPRAPLAAFTLGRVSLDALGRPAQAAAAFRRAIELGLPQSLQEDAYARLVEARARAGDDAGARAAALEYEQHFRDGKRLREVQRWLRAD